MATVCSTFDERHSRIKPVARKLVTVTILNAASSGNTVTEINGRILEIVADVPDLTGAGTLALDLKDEDGTLICAQKAAIAENAKTRLVYSAAATPHGAVCSGAVTFLCTASAGAQTGAQTINLIVYYI